MEMTFHLFLNLISLATFCSGNKVPLHIGAIYPLTKDFSAWGQGCLPAAKMAIDDINERQDILDDYELKLVSRDSQGSPGMGMREFFRLIQLNETIIMILGPFPSHIAQAVAETAKWWNLITVSPAAFTPELSDRNRYPYFFRTRAALSTFNEARLALLRHFGWKRAAILTRNMAYFIHTANLLSKAMKENNVTSVTSDVFQNDADPVKEVARIKALNARIIFVLVYEEYARKVFCQAYKQGVYGKKYVWILHFGNDPLWMNKGTADGSCTAEEIQKAANYHLIISDITLREDSTMTTSGYNTSNFIAKYTNLAQAMNTTPSTFYAPLTYDAAWAIALALNSSEGKLPPGERLENYTYENAANAQLFTKELEGLEFEGMTGTVAFSPTGDISSLKTRFRQYRDNKFYDVGHHDAQTDRIVIRDTLAWQSPDVPPDDLRVFDLRVTIPTTALTSMTIVAMLGVILSVILLWFNITYRSHKIIRMSSPNLNNFIIIGCAVSYISIILYGMDGNLLHRRGIIAVCQTRMVILSIGFSLVFGALFAKTWRVYIIFTNQTTKRVMIADYKLLLIVAAMVSVDVIIFLLWFFIDPPDVVKYRDIAVPAPNDEDYLLTPVSEVCQSQHHTVWTGIIYGIKGILLTFGVFLAVQTRNVSIPVLNDSKHIGFAVYNVMTTCLLGVPMTFILAPSQLTPLYIIVAVCIALSVTVTQCLVFIPKVYAVKTNKIEDLTQSAFSQSVQGTQSSKIANGNVTCNNCGAMVDISQNRSIPSIAR